MSTLPENATTDHHQAPVMALGSPNVGPRAKRWSREEYYRLGEQGWFHDQRVELINGELIVLTPQSYAHANSIHLIFNQLSNVFGTKFSVRMQVPLLGGTNTEPEPDISVVPGSWQDYTDHPQTAVLVVEVSNTSLEFDLNTKSHLYASMAVPDYWVLDLENRQLHLHREPIADEAAPFNHRYQQIKIISVDSQIAPLEKPDAAIAVVDILPPKK